MKDNFTFPGNQAFAPALLDPDLDVPCGIIGPDGKPAPKRFGVYRNNVVTSLMEAMADTYPAIKRIVGEDNFATLARVYISKHPPSSPVMQAYGDLFPQFISEFVPLQHSPFLVDVAQVEKNWIGAYHAADALPLEGAQLGKIDTDKLMETRFITHPATSVISSPYALYDLFHLRNETNLHEVSYEKCNTDEAVLITRAHLIVEVNRLDQASAKFFTLITSGHSLGKSVGTAMQTDENFDVSSAIALMISSAAMMAISNDTD